jgi:Peptidase family M28
MRETTRRIQLCTTAGILLVIFTLAIHPGLAQQADREAHPVVTPPNLPPPPAPALYNLDDAYLEWNLAPGDQKYASIDGHHLKQYVMEQTAISHRYRDAGHQFWGRIIGTEADAEDARWLLDKFRAAGLSDVHLQSFDLPPQWMPQSWAVTASGGGMALQLPAAQPAYLTPGTSPAGLDLEAVYAGLGSEADFRGRDVRGKAVLLFSMPQPDSLWNSAASEGAFERAEAKGAAAILEVIAAPGNFRMQLYPKGNNVPIFSIGDDDGNALRDLIAEMPAGQAPRVNIRLDVQRVPGMKTATVWGALPGTSDETIYVVAHRDGWFEGANDNASGVATLIGLAEYFGRIPEQQRRRTIVFLGTSGHHNGAAASGGWLAEHKELFAKTALMINCEHTAGVQAYLRGPVIREANQTDGFTWYVGGSDTLAKIVTGAYRDFGVATYAHPERNAGGEMGPFFKFAPSIQVLQGGIFFHSDQDTADKVTRTGLAAITRAYAKIIDAVNKVDRKDLVPSDEPVIIYR